MKSSMFSLVRLVERSLWTVPCSTSSCSDTRSRRDTISSCMDCSCRESVFEDLAAKQSVFQAVERLVGSEFILSSSTSCLLPSDVFSAVQMPNRCVVSHSVGQCPVRLNKEIDGFALNRVQYAIIAVSWRL
ncbi:hypothetical protein CRUP_031419, partial [Coryphaenoides rupestris]